MPHVLKLLWVKDLSTPAKKTLAISIREVGIKDSEKIIDTKPDDVYHAHVIIRSIMRSENYVIASIEDHVGPKVKVYSIERYAAKFLFVKP